MNGSNFGQLDRSVDAGSPPGTLNLMEPSILHSNIHSIEPLLSACLDYSSRERVIQTISME
jgi:hypothetical protein